MNVRLLKIIGAVALGFVLALAAGWVWGASGRYDLASAPGPGGPAGGDQRRARAAPRRACQSVSLNFGAATGNLEAAKIPLAAVVHR